MSPTTQETLYETDRVKVVRATYGDAERRLQVLFKPHTYVCWYHLMACDADDRDAVMDVVDELLDLAIVLKAVR